MRNKRLIFLSVLAVTFLVSTFVCAAVPHLVRFQGKITDKAGAPLTGSYNVTFRLYNAETGGLLKWSETQTGIPVNNGIFTVLLGNVTSLNLPFDEAYWLSIEVNSDGEMAPRQSITTVGYAIHAETAENFLGGSAGLVPQNAIILWTGASCPTGYTRVSELDGKFIVGGATYNAAAGGSERHTHTAGTYTGPNHTHTYSGTTGGGSLTGYHSSGPNPDALPWHTHSYSGTTDGGGVGAITGISGEADSRPPFATIIFCRKD